MLCAAVALLASALPAATARADGDPASDVLVTQRLFLPWDAELPSAEQARLSVVMQSARQSGFPIRVALIAAAEDLGSVGALWRQPQAYASFLGEELSLVHRGPLLVVMPNGFGLSGFRAPSGRLDAALSGMRAPADGAQLGRVTITAIQRLAAAEGHPLPQVLGALQLVSDGGGASRSAIELAVLALGLLAMAAAWTASLRARPLRARRG